VTIGRKYVSHGRQSPGPATAAESWMDQAQCRSTPDEKLFPAEHQKTEQFYAWAVKVCVGCPVVAQCLAHADSFEGNDPKINTGVFGGMSPEDRVARRRKMRRAARAAS
jgi:hypothetical protein